MTKSELLALGGYQTRTGTSLREIGLAALEAAEAKGREPKTQPAPRNRKREASPKPPTEHQEQAKVFQWAETEKAKLPMLEMLFAIPNGAGVNHQHGRNGKRFSLEGAKLKREGMKQGVPDTFLACPVGQWHGMFIEMKRAKKSLSKTSPEQIAWHGALRSMGYRVEVCYGAEAAKAAILDYLGAK